MELNDNPILKPENYWEGYKESIENLKNHPEFLSFDKLCFETFNTDFGKALMEMIEKRYLFPSLADRNNANYALQIIWADGFKDAFRHIKNCITSHEQRIKSG